MNILHSSHKLGGLVEGRVFRIVADLNRPYCGYMLQMFKRTNAVAAGSRSDVFQSSRQVLDEAGEIMPAEQQFPTSALITLQSSGIGTGERRVGREHIRFQVTFDGKASQINGAGRVLWPEPNRQTESSKWRTAT